MMSNRLFVFFASLSLIPLANGGEMYPFTINEDAMNGVTQSKLNQQASPNGIEEKDRIIVKDGHFYTIGNDLIPNTLDDHRVRFWGVNLTPPVTFPRDQAEADMLADRLQKLGFNVVRLHGMDLPYSLFTPESFPTFNSANLDALDRFMAALKARGIYANIVLKTWWRFRPGVDCLDPIAKTGCVPGNPDDISQHSKPVDLFNAEMRALQKKYAMALMSHVNPYTGVAYKNEPALAFLELNNENSLITYFYKDASNKALPAYYEGELNKLWNGWLINKYANTSNLSNAWQMLPEDTPGKSMIVNGDFSNEFAPWNLRAGDDGVSASWSITPEGALKVEVAQESADAWRIGVRQSSSSSSVLKTQKGKDYVLRFTAWTDDAPRNIRVDVSHINTSGQTLLSLKPSLYPLLSAKPQQFVYCFTAKETGDAHLLFSLGKDNDGVHEGGYRIYLDDVEFRAGGPINGLPDSETLENASVTRLQKEGNSCPTRQRERDYIGFLSDTERDYFSDMKNYLKNTAGSRQMITGTQGQYSGLVGNRNTSELMDYVDTHYFFAHPKWAPESQWSATDWWMKNSPMLKEPNSMPFRISANRVHGKPFTLSEYSQGTTNQFTQESLPITAAFAAMQDIDAVYLFNYHVLSNADARDTWNPNWLENWSTVLGDPRIESLLPISSHIFRRVDSRRSEQLLKIHVNENCRIRQIRSGVGIQDAGILAALQDPACIQDPDGEGVRLAAALNQRVALVHTEDPQPDLPSSVKSSPYMPDTREYQWNRGNQGEDAHFLLDTDRSKAFIGYINGLNTPLSGLNIEGTGGAGQFGTVAATSADDKPLLTSSSWLVTSIGTAVNAGVSVQTRPPDARHGAGMATLCETVPNPACPTAWNDSAQGPVMVEANAATITYRGAATSLIVESLDENSAPVATIPVTPVSGGWSFNVGTGGDNTPWYRVTAQLPQPVVIEAESGAITGNDNMVTANGKASGTAQVLLAGRGGVTLTVPPATASGNYFIELRAQGQEYGGPALLKVSHNGSVLETLSLPETLNRSYQYFLVGHSSIAIQPGDTFHFEFVNDKYTHGTQDRNVRIDRVNLYRAGN